MPRCPPRAAAAGLPTVRLGPAPRPAAALRRPAGRAPARRCRRRSPPSRCSCRAPTPCAAASTSTRTTCSTTTARTPLPGLGTQPPGHGQLLAQRGRRRATPTRTAPGQQRGGPRRGAGAARPRTPWSSGSRFNTVRDADRADRDRGHRHRPRRRPGRRRLAARRGDHHPGRRALRDRLGRRRRGDRTPTATRPTTVGCRRSGDDRPATNQLTVSVPRSDAGPGHRDVAPVRRGRSPATARPRGTPTARAVGPGQRRPEVVRTWPSASTSPSRRNPGDGAGTVPGVGQLLRGRPGEGAGGRARPTASTPTWTSARLAAGTDSEPPPAGPHSRRGSCPRRSSCPRAYGASSRSSAGASSPTCCGCPPGVGTAPSPRGPHVLACTRWGAPTPSTRCSRPRQLDAVRRRAREPGGHPARPRPGRLVHRRGRGRLLRGLARRGRSTSRSTPTAPIPSGLLDGRLRHLQARHRSTPTCSRAPSPRWARRGWASGRWCAPPHPGRAGRRSTTPKLAERALDPVPELGRRAGPAGALRRARPRSRTASTRSKLRSELWTFQSDHFGLAILDQWDAARDFLGAARSARATRAA